MSDLVFCDKLTGDALMYDVERSCFLYRQYRKNGWLVKTNLANIIPHVKVGDNVFIPLQPFGRDFRSFAPSADDLSKALRYESSKLGYQDENLESFAGLLYLYDLTVVSKPRVLTPSLMVETGSLDHEKEFIPIVRRLNQLAFLCYSPTVMQVPSSTAPQLDPKGAGSHLADHDRLLIETSQAFKQACISFSRNWKLIRSAPAKEARQVPIIIDIRRHSKPQPTSLINKSRQRPDVHRMEILTTAETFDTQENRFLVFALNDMHKKAQVFTGRLLLRAEQLKRDWGRLNEPTDRYINRNEWIDRQKEYLKTSNDMRTMAESIKRDAVVLASYKSDSFLQQAKRQASYPSCPSKRLTDSSEYGPIFKSYSQFRRTTKPLFIPLRHGMEKALANHSVHPVHRLYEIWVFVELYDMLITRFGFAPDNHTTHPLALVDIVDGEPISKKLSGQCFRLHLTLEGEVNPVLSLNLYYDTEFMVQECASGKRCYDNKVCPYLYCFDKIMKQKHWKRLRPDILMELSYQNKPFRFALDVKYRRYSEQAKYWAEERQAFDADSVYELDLLGTAKMKYLDALGCTAAYIVHSDPDNAFTYWGEEPWSKHPHREMARGENKYFPNHKIGTVFASPRNLYNLECLLKNMLMYHARIENICWACRKKVEPQKMISDQVSNQDRQVRKKSVGNCYQCPECRSFWVVTWCQNRTCLNHILKLGQYYTIHKPDLNYKNCYLCPKCGTGFVPQTIRFQSQFDHEHYTN